MINDLILPPINAFVLYWQNCILTSYIVESGMVLVQPGAAQCADTVTSDGDGELDSKKQDWGVDTGVKHGLYLFSTEIHVQGYLPPSKVALSFIQRVEFQTNKCLYGSSNDCGPNWRGAKRTTNKLSVFAQARARNTELPVLCCLNLSGGVPQSFILYLIYFILYVLSLGWGNPQAATGETQNRNR